VRDSDLPFRKSLTGAGYAAKASSLVPGGAVTGCCSAPAAGLHHADGVYAGTARSREPSGDAIPSGYALFGIAGSLESMLSSA